MSKLPDLAALRKLVAASACEEKWEAVSVLWGEDFKTPFRPRAAKKGLSLGDSHYTLLLRLPSASPYTRYPLWCPGVGWA